MHTFLVSADIEASAKCLDRLRLGKQRVESHQIIKILEELERINPIEKKMKSWEERIEWREEAIRRSKKKIAWVRHPAVLLWVGYLDGLKYYYNCHLKEWANRGYRNVILQSYELPGIINLPAWTQNRDFLENHRGALLKKELERNEKPWYVKRLFDVPEFLGYIWQPKINKLII